MTIANTIFDLTGVDVFSSFSLSLMLALTWIVTDDLKNSDSRFPNWIPQKWFLSFLKLVVWVKKWKS